MLEFDAGFGRSGPQPAGRRDDALAHQGMNAIPIRHHGLLTLRFWRGERQRLWGMAQSAPMIEFAATEAQSLRTMSRILAVYSSMPMITQAPTATVRTSEQSLHIVLRSTTNVSN